MARDFPSGAVDLGRERVARGELDRALSPSIDVISS